jgi:hypothetical protein
MTRIIPRGERERAVQPGTEFERDGSEQELAAVRVLDRLAWAVEDAHGQARRMRMRAPREEAYREQAI